jgi:type II secretory pathway component PulK
MKNVLQEEKGLALVVALLVVALLAITVVDFTFSATIDRHMARNSLHALQASLLARSGVNIGEGFLLEDDNNRVDAFSEEWCPEPQENACRIDAALFGLPAGMALEVRIRDESGKLNVNAVRPQNAAECGRFDDPNENNPLRIRLDVLGRLLEGRGVDPDAIEAYETYWREVCEAIGLAPSAQATPGTFRPSAERTRRAAVELRAHEFSSLDGLTGIPGFAPSTVRRLRHVLTALRGASVRINANTAPRRVLTAVLDDEGIVDDIIARREEAPLERTDLASFRGALPPERSFAYSLLGVTSVLYRVCAVATVNANPLTGTGGVRRSASMLVRRGPGFNPNPPPDTPRWRPFTRMEWQKEGGASLCLDEEAESSGEDDFLALESFRTDR